MKKSTKNTLVLIVLILLIACSMLAIQRLVLTKHGSYAVISIDGKEVERLDLDKDQELTVETSYGGYNIVEVKNNKVFVKEADCKNQVCVNTGEISESYDVIACLPHGLTVTIETQ